MKNLISSILFSIMVIPVLMVPKQTNMSSLSYNFSNSISDSNVMGIDVSVYQNKISWYKIEDIDFVFIKATEGLTLQDKMFLNNWDSAKSNKLIRGAYHFYRPNVRPQDQYKNFTNIVSLESGDLPPVLDAEIQSRNKLKLIKDYKIWLDLVEEHYKISPIIYCSWSYYKNYFSSDEFKKYNFWIANYVIQDLCLLTQDWHFWQHTCYGKVPGITGYVDKNKFNGTYEDLISLCKK